jgi:TetR/AcrR family transcriptional regulator, tetracycline repressor protein
VTEAVSAETVLDTAARLIELHGVEAFTMRGLAEELGVAVTSIYWHVGGRDKLFDSLVDRLLSEMAHLPIEGDTAVERIASLARSQRRALIDRQHLLAIAHERDRTPTLFLPIQQTLAAQLAELGMTGTDAALVLRAVQVHVISSAVMQFSAVRGAKHEEEDPYRLRRRLRIRPQRAAGSAALGWLKRRDQAPDVAPPRLGRPHHPGTAHHRFTDER